MSGSATDQIGTERPTGYPAASYERPAGSSNGYERARELLLDAADEPLGASPLTLAEVLVGPARAGHLDRGTAALNQLEVTSVRLAEDAPTRLAVLRAGTGLKMPHCCVLLAAEQTHGTVATFDDRLAKTATEHGIVVRIS